MTDQKNADLIRGLDAMSKNPRTRNEHREFLARCRDALEAAQTALDRVNTTTHLPVQVSDAVNRAAEDVLGLAGREDDRLVDAVNLVVNAGLHYIEHPDDGLDDAIEANYADTEPDDDHDIAQTVRGWLSD